MISFYFLLSFLRFIKPILLIYYPRGIKGHNGILEENLIQFRHTLQGLVFAGIGWQIAGIFAHWGSSCFLKDGYLNTILVTEVEMYILYTSKHTRTHTHTI